MNICLATLKRRQIALYLTLMAATGFLLSSVSLVYAQDSVTASIELPPGFRVDEITGLNFPTDMAFLPNGDMLVLEKGVGDGPDSSANVRVVRDGVLRPEPVLTMATNTFRDSGLLGLAIDPDFASNGYVYIWHATGKGSLDWSGETVNRLSRFTVDSVTEIADPATELIVLDDAPYAPMHSGGGLSFDADGNLYVPIGDVGMSDRTMSLNFLNGKVLRITPTEDGYTIPGDNPYRNDPDALPEIYASGLRNPFRTVYRASDGHLYIADVGNEHWEEINRGAPGANYGWRVREGPCPTGETMPCAAPSPVFTDPVLYYPHPPDMGGSVTGLTFYTGSEFPEEYVDQLFYADLNLATIDVGVLRGNDFEILPFAANVRGIVDLEYHDERLYYLDIISSKIGVITYTNTPNQLPIAVAEADVIAGPSPLRVHFDAHASHDPDGEILEYRWDFGDGSDPVVTKKREIAHKYAIDGAYRAALVVVDDRGAGSEATELEIQVYSGAFPKITLSNLTEPGRDLFHGGDSWEYAAQRAGSDDDLDPNRPYVWQVAMHHNQHSHPIIIGQVADRAVLELDRDNHGGAWNIWYRFHLYMNTVSGQQVHVSTEVRPALVALTVDASPETTDINVNGVRQTTPYQYRAISGVEQTITAPSELFTDGGIGAFDYWHVHTGGWPANAREVEVPPELNAPMIDFIVPVSSTTYTAFYHFDRPANKVYLPMVENSAP